LIPYLGGTRNAKKQVQEGGPDLTPGYGAEDSIGRIERAMRNAIHDVLWREAGPNWHENERVGLGRDWAADLARKQQDDVKSRSSPVTSETPFSYAEFLDLISLLEKNQEHFKRVFPDWDALIVYLGQVHRLRNAVKHHREITESQWALLSGIEGEIADAVALWRAGVRLGQRATVVWFSRRILTDGKDDASILAESGLVVGELLALFRAALCRAGVDPSRVVVEPVSDYSGRVSVPHLEVVVQTPNDSKPRSCDNGVNFKSASAVLTWKAGCRQDLDVILRDVAIPYGAIEYQLEGPLDVEALRTWCEQRAGLTASSSMSSDGVLTSFEVSLLGGRLRLRASTSAGARIGTLQAVVHDASGFLTAHLHIGAREIIGLMVGDVSPRAMMHLLQKSLRTSS
jgi:hypothetical protein